MLPSENIYIEDFWVVGINYKNTDTAERGAFAVQPEQYEAILNEAREEFGIEELFVLSTCNRTEVYGITPNVSELERLLIDHTIGNAEYFSEKAYRKRGKKAIGHIFNVATGLDSQILGDYEIVGQFKNAVNFARERGTIGLFTDRLFKNVLQACRAIRSQTNLSSGTVSVAYASVLFLKEHLPQQEINNILILGLGKIGKNVCKNLLEAFPNTPITLINRTEEKAEELATQMGSCIKVRPYQEMETAVRDADVVIVATNSPQPVLTKENFVGNSPKLLLDLSIPNNIHPEVTLFPHIILADVDKLSKIADETLKRRELEVPAAKTFITTYIHKFAEWYLMRRNVPVLKEVREKLSELNSQLSDAKNANDKELMQKIINNMAAKMRKENLKSGCYYIEAINGYLDEVATSHH